MRPWFAPPPRPARAIESAPASPAPVRAVEASPEVLVATGARPGWYGRDPIDGDVGYRPAGAVSREAPWWTLERARAYSVAAYRSNPMATAIIDTYTAFCVGDSGLKIQATNPEVAAVV